MNDRAASAVTVLILLVTLMTMLVALPGVFFLGPGGEVRHPGPEASLTFDFVADDAIDGAATQLEDGSDGGRTTASTLAITHHSGESLAASRLVITDGDETVPGTVFPSRTATAGTAATVAVDSEDTIRVVWRSRRNDTAVTVARWTGPGA